jgi:hypothetical protein
VTLISRLRLAFHVVRGDAGPEADEQIQAVLDEIRDTERRLEAARRKLEEAVLSQAWVTAQRDNIVRRTEDNDVPDVGGHQ